MHQNLLKTKLINKNCVFELLWIKSNLIHQAIKNFIVCETIKTNYVLRVRVVLRNLLLQETDDRCMNNTFLHFTMMQRYFAYDYGSELQNTMECEIYVKEGPFSKECSKHLVFFRFKLWFNFWSPCSLPSGIKTNVFEQITDLYTELYYFIFSKYKT